MVIEVKVYIYALYNNTKLLMLIYSRQLLNTPPSLHYIHHVDPTLENLHKIHSNLHTSYPQCNMFSNTLYVYIRAH